MIRVGIVGAGKNTQEKHIPKLLEIDDVEIISVCNRSQESSRRVADRFDIPRIYENWQELVKAEDTNAVVISTWPYLHCPVTVAALKANKHVLVEARMAMNTAEAREMLRMAQAKPNLVCQIVPSPFSFEVDATIQRLIKEDYLGDILAIEIKDHGDKFLNVDAPLQWRQDSELSGVNIMSLGIWYESLMRWVGEAAQVMAMGKVFAKNRQKNESGEIVSVTIPEHLSVIADMEGGAQATFSISQITGLLAEKSVTLFGSEGTLRFSGGKLFGGKKDDTNLSKITISDDEKGYWRVEEEFVNAIRGLETVQFTTFEIGVEYMAFTEAVMHSVKEGRLVEVQRT